MRSSPDGRQPSRSRGDHKPNVPSHHRWSKVSDRQSPHCLAAWRGGPVGMVFSSNGTEVAPLQWHPPFLHHPIHIDTSIHSPLPRSQESPPWPPPPHLISPSTVALDTLTNRSLLTRHRSSQARLCSMRCRTC